MEGWLKALLWGLGLGLVTIPIARILKPRLFWGSAVMDPSGVPWVVALLLFGPGAALLASTVGAIGIWRVSREATPGLGAFMKWLGTLPVWGVPALAVALALGGGYPNAALADLGLYLALGLLAWVGRCLLALTVNYYYSIPRYRSTVTGGRRTTPEVMAEFGGTQRYILILGAFNLYLTAFDVVVSWAVGYPTGLSRLVG